jgi:hypothetical protein
MLNNKPAPQNNSILAAMPETGGHIKRIAYIALLCFILFSFSPCSVKNVWTGSFNAGFVKLPAPSKTTLPANSCSYPNVSRQLNTLVQQSKFNQQIEPADFVQQEYLIPVSVTLPGDAKTFSGTAPPQYILYKRWKIGIA